MAFCLDISVKKTNFGLHFNTYMTILDTINESKRKEVEAAKRSASISSLKESSYFERETNSLRQRLTDASSSGIIAEFKRKSPSKGAINPDADVIGITAGYALAGAAGVSVLTDGEYFGGSKYDLVLAREANPTLPLLRKDFMLDPYQLYEAKAWGADVVLLIAASLTPAQVSELSHEARELGLEVLLEVHDLEELDRSPLAFVDIVGVNNRNLKNFNESSIQASLDLVEHIPAEMVKISESCISNPETIKTLRKAGFHGFLIGESFMKTENPAKALQDYILQSDL